MQIVDQVEAYGASLHILGLTLTPPAAGTLVLQILGEHERTMMLERQRVGIAKAKSEGKFKGRARTVMAKAGEVEVMLFVIDQFDDGDDAIQWCKKFKLEGVVSKKRDAPYVCGECRSWVKSKCATWKEDNRETLD